MLWEVERGARSEALECFLKLLMFEQFLTGVAAFGCYGKAGRLEGRVASYMFLIVRRSVVQYVCGHPSTHFCLVLLLWTSILKKSCLTGMQFESFKKSVLVKSFGRTKNNSPSSLSTV